MAADGTHFISSSHNHQKADSCDRMSGPDFTLVSSNLSGAECKCQTEKTAAAISSHQGGCGLRRRATGGSSSSISLTNTVFLAVIMLACLSHLTCCVSAWPILSQRRTYNYAPASLEIPSDYDLDVDQWALASQPLTAAAIAPPAYYDLAPFTQQQQQQQQQQEEDDYDDQLFEDNPEELYQMPYFGPVLDVEPEEELELEELKHQQPYVYEKRRPSRVQGTGIPPTVTASNLPATTPSTSTEAAPAHKSTAHPASTSSSSSSSTATSSSDPKKPVHPAPFFGNGGQKEIAMLRPPSAKSPRQPGIQLDEPEEPQISVAQRSYSNEKPSAYDRLRKYLSLDDALKKEYQQRRSNAVSRHAKRESISSIITDSDSLTGQLNSLKKKVD